MIVSGIQKSVWHLHESAEPLEFLFRQIPSVQCTVPPLVRVFRSTYSVTRAMKSWARSASGGLLH
jgi:hypothetical protein